MSEIKITILINNKYHYLSFNKKNSNVSSKKQLQNKHESNQGNQLKSR